MSLNNRKILFLIFSPLFTKGGHSKNFLNIIKYLEPEIIKNNFNAGIISYNNDSCSKKENDKNISELNYFKAFKIKLFRRIFPSGNVLFQVSEFILNFLRPEGRS